MGGKPGKERVAAASVPEVSGVDIGEAKGDNFGWIHNAAPRPKEVGTLETIKEWWKGGGEGAVCNSWRKSISYPLKKWEMTKGVGGFL